MSIEAMKQALEALVTHGSPWLRHEKQYTDAIASLRQAIDKAEKREPKKWVKVECPLCGEMAVAHTHPVLTTPQPQSEQIIYQLSPTDIYDFAGWLTTRKGLMQVGGAYEAGPMADAVGEYLKTFPERFDTSQREWVGLTDAEIEEFDYYARDLVMDIEKALKERNNVA